MLSRPSAPRRTSSLKRFFNYSLDALSSRSRNTASKAGRSSSGDHKLKTNSISYPTALIHCSSGICEGTWSDWELCDGVAKYKTMGEADVMDVQTMREANAISGARENLLGSTRKQVGRQEYGAVDTKQKLETTKSGGDRSFDWIQIPTSPNPASSRSSIDSQYSRSTHHTRQRSSLSSMRTITSLPFHLDNFDYSFEEFGREWGDGSDARGSVVVEDGCEDEKEAQRTPTFHFTYADATGSPSTTHYHPFTTHSQRADDSFSFLDLDTTSLSLLPNLPFPPPPVRC